MTEANVSSVPLFTMANTVEASHYPELKAVLATWISFNSADARAAAERYVLECGRVHATTLIVDVSANPGVPSQADFEWIESHGVELTKRNGVRFVLNVHGTSAVSSMGPKRWNKSGASGGLSMYDCASLADALSLAAELAAGRAA